MTPLPGKGGNSLAQAFLSNTATQPTAVPTITQPVQQGLPSMGSLAPMTGAGGQQTGTTMGLMPPGFEKMEGMGSLWRAPNGWLYNPDNKGWIEPHTVYNPNIKTDQDLMMAFRQDGPPGDQQYAPDVRIWDAIRSQFGGQMPQAQAQPSGQMSQAQLLARAMNQAAMQGR